MHAIVRLLFQCEHCGKCCKLSRSYTQADVDRIESYTCETRELITKKLESPTCGYQVDNLCSIHFIKPGVCKWWPGPGTMSCPGYKKAVDKYCKPGMMSTICNDPELTELYTKCIIHNDIEAAKTILKRFNIEI